MSNDGPAQRPVIAGFWRRIAAFLLDVVLLGILGTVLGLLFFQLLVDIGGWGRLIGYAIAVAYFGTFNGRSGNGQTVGKRVLGIKVVDRGGMAITAPRAYLRAVVLGLPWFINLAPAPPAIPESIWGHVTTIAVFGLGLSIVYLYLFNRRSRQSLHDLLVDSYVVNADARDAMGVPRPWRMHFAVCAILFAVAAIVPLVLLKGSAQYAALVTAQHAIEQQPGIAHAGVSQGSATFITSNGKRETTTYFDVVARLRDAGIGDPNRARQIARQALAAAPAAADAAHLRVTLVYGFDIGIAKYNQSRSYAHRPAEWLAD